MNKTLPKRFVVPGFTESIADSVAPLPKHVQVYLVGGAVRDLCLGLPAKDRDWVVVGATPQELIQAGFTPVGAEFPVFLHPDTKEEYALARTERKAGHGYKGFRFFADPSVTLAQDLTRRDLTINAMAIDADGQLIDPLGGFDDLQNKVLRHIGPAFSEDPLRVLRLARFAARFAQYSIHPDTMALCHHISISGELGHLVPERIQAELSKGFAEAAPSRMWSLLSGIHAWRALLLKHLQDEHLEHVVGVFQAIVPASMDALHDDVMHSQLWRWCFVLNCIPSDALHELAKAWRVPTETLSCAVVWSKTNAILSKTGWHDLDCETQLHQLAEYLHSVDVYRKPERLQLILQGFSKVSENHNQAIFEHLQRACTSVLCGQYKRWLAEGLQGHDGTHVSLKVAFLRKAWLMQIGV